MEPVATPFYKSKRFYLNLAAVVAVVYPPSAKFIADNITETGAVWGVLNIILNFVSKGKVSIS